MPHYTPSSERKGRSQAPYPGSVSTPCAGTFFPLPMHPPVLSGQISVMSLPAPTPEPIRALDLAKATPDELAEDRRAVFKRLLGYVKPLKARLIWGILFGVLAGVFNGVLLLVLKSVFTIVLPGARGEAKPEVYFPSKISTLPRSPNFRSRLRIFRRTRNGSLFSSSASASRSCSRFGEDSTFCINTVCSGSI